MIKPLAPEQILAPTLDERMQCPCAVGIQINDHATTYTHFPVMMAAHLFAMLFEPVDGITVTRWVAVLEDEWSAETPIPGWRKVTYFNV